MKAETYREMLQQIPINDYYFFEFIVFETQWRITYIKLALTEQFESKDVEKIFD
jgi:hypothetical protein